MSVIDHECPGCGATIVFNPKNQNWVCGYCNSEYKIEDFKNNSKKEDEENKKVISNVFKCSSCGSVVTTDKYTSATYCAYCGSTAINKKRLSGDFNPNKIIPFKLSKEDAIEKFLEMQNRYKFMPKLFNKKENIDKIYGMYVPFWFFDVNTIGTVKAIAYKYYGPGDPDSSGFYKEMYELVREGKFKFKNIPVDASLKLDDDLMFSLGPFNYDEMVEYNHAYLSGFLAEINSISDKECFDKLKPLFEDTYVKVIKSRELNYSNIDPYEVKIDFNEFKKKCVLIPVWLVNVKYNNKNFLLAINGQTGKIVGDVPFNKYKFTIFGIFFLMILCIIVLLVKEVILL